jgi:hypothetical protein
MAVEAAGRRNQGRTEGRCLCSLKDEAISPLYDISSGEEEGPTVITRRQLRDQQQPSQPGALHYDGGGWEKIAVAKLVLGGAAVRSEVEKLPRTVAVLRSAGSVYQVSGWLSPGRELHSDAATTLSLLNPTGLSPAADGTLSGSVASFPEGQAYEVYPSIRVQTQEQADAVNAIMASPDLRNQHINAVLEAVESGALTASTSTTGGSTRCERTTSRVRHCSPSNCIAAGWASPSLASLPEEEGTSWDTGRTTG